MSTFPNQFILQRPGLALLPNANTYTLSEVRSISFSMAAGTVAYAIDTSGFTTVIGCWVVQTAPAAHWLFRMFPRVSDIVVQNDGAVQNCSLNYVVLGKP